MARSESSYFPLRLLCKKAPANCLFGPTTKQVEYDCIRPDVPVPLNATVIWLPDQHKSVSLESYLWAQKTGNQEALDKITSLGIPLGINFGV